MIKITSGKYRSRVIATPEQGTLPTKNMVREAMMSMVTGYLDGANVLDLFAGSGALGIEALSRGARKATFVDASRDAAKIVVKNLETLQETNGAVLNLDYVAALGRLQEKFSLVFIDPPYANKEAYQRSLDILLEKNLLEEEAAVILEYEGDLSVDTGAFSSRRDYTYGKTKVILLQR